MDPEEQQRKLDEAAKRRREELDAAIAAFALALSYLADNWQAEIEHLLQTRGARLSPAQLYPWLTAQIPALLDRLGYASLLRDTTAQYVDAITATQEQLAEAELTGSLTRDEQANLRTMQQADHDRLRLLGTVAGASLVSGLVLARIAAQPKANEVKDAIEKPIRSFRASAEQMVETGLYTADRYAYWQATSKVVQKYRFAGPKDERNSKFCAEHVNKTYTSAQIDNLNNGQSVPYNNVFLYGGHIGCRHVWVAQISQV